MKKLILVLIFISSNAWAISCHKFNNDEIDLPGFDLIFRCEMEKEICYFSNIHYGYSVSCVPKTK